MANYNSSYTGAQIDAAIGAVTDKESTWDGKYAKPAGGIPKTDLASAVQTSLGKADTALQSYTETDPTVPSWAKQSTKPSYTAAEVGALPGDTTIPAASTTAPLMDGTASYGSGTAYARSNHVHPTDTSRAPLASPALTGNPTAPTQAAGNNSTRIATTAFVQTALGNKLTYGDTDLTAGSSALETGVFYFVYE